MSTINIDATLTADSSLNYYRTIPVALVQDFVNERMYVLDMVGFQIYVFDTSSLTGTTAPLAINTELRGGATLFEIVGFNYGGILPKLQFDPNSLGLWILTRGPQDYVLLFTDPTQTGRDAVDGRGESGYNTQLPSGPVNDFVITTDPSDSSISYLYGAVDGALGYIGQFSVTYLASPNILQEFITTDPAYFPQQQESSS